MRCYISRAAGALASAVFSCEFSVSPKNMFEKTAGSFQGTPRCFVRSQKKRTIPTPGDFLLMTPSNPKLPEIARLRLGRRGALGALAGRLENTGRDQGRDDDESPPSKRRERHGLTDEQLRGSRPVNQDKTKNRNVSRNE
jgi:hypothetical protein